MIWEDLGGRAGILGFSGRRRRFFCVFCFFFVVSISGCGSRRTTASRPEPAQPEAAETSDNAEQPRKIERASGPAANAPRIRAPGTAVKRYIPPGRPAPGSYPEHRHADVNSIPSHG